MAEPDHVTVLGRPQIDPPSLSQPWEQRAQREGHKDRPFGTVTSRLTALQ